MKRNSLHISFKALVATLLIIIVLLLAFSYLYDYYESSQNYFDKALCRTASQEVMEAALMGGAIPENEQEKYGVDSFSAVLSYLDKKGVPHYYTDVRKAAKLSEWLSGISFITLRSLPDYIKSVREEQAFYRIEYVQGADKTTLIIISPEE